MRTDLACTERVTIWPRSSPETFLKLPIFAMMCVPFTSGPRQSRPRCAGRAGRQTAPQPKARSEAEDGSDQTFLVRGERSEEHTSALQSLMRISYDVFCLKKKKTNQ